MNGRKLHFVGICGAGMSGLALIARAMGAEVTGSDRSVAGPYGDRLRAAGIDPVEGHAAGNVPEGAEVVYSSAVPEGNPERAVARAELHRADLLGELTRLKPTIAVTGTHGKTTTSSMVVHALAACGLDPAYAVGGEVRSTGTNAAWGEGPWLVVEADESDRSFLALDVDVAVVTNVELDHHTTWSSERELDEAFREFLAKAPATVVPVDDARVRMLVAGESTTFGAWEGPALAVPGEHNRRNAAAALEAAVLAGASREEAAAALATFGGAGRRFEELGVTASGARVVDDYAHHPTEVAATIAAARERTDGRVVAVFQPHLYSRTQHLAREFGAALAAADVPAVLEVYPARERAEDFPGVTGRLIAEAAADAGGGRPVLWLPGFDDAERVLGVTLREGDLVLVLGAGDVDALGRRLVDPQPP